MRLPFKGAWDRQLMPINKFAMARYRLIHQLLSRQDYVKTSKMVVACEQQLGYEVTRRTIQIDLQVMKDDSFVGIYAPIAYCARRKAYFYERKDFMSRHLGFSESEIEFVQTIKERWSPELTETEHDRLAHIVEKMQLIWMAK